MSNKSRLQTNNTNLQLLINKANALPDAGGSSSGGGSENTDTCNVTIKTDYQLYAISAFGPEGYIMQNEFPFNQITLTVYCNSVIYIHQIGYYSATITAGTILSETWGDGLVYQSPSTPNISATINITTD